MTLANIPQTVITIEPANLKRWTVQDYHRMSDLGLLSGDRTELITGQITLMAAKGTPHVTSLHLLANVLRDRLGNLALVRTQDPIHLDDFSEPEPDLVSLTTGFWLPKNVNCISFVNQRQQVTPSSLFLLSQTKPRL